MAEFRLKSGARLACVGKPGSGKSSLARALFVAQQGRRVVIDPYDSELTMGEWPTTDSSHPDFDVAAIWRVVPPRPRDLDYYDELYGHLFEQGHCTVWTDELMAVTTSHEIPEGFEDVLFRGRKKHITHIGTTQRPVMVNPAVWSLADVWAIFRLPYVADQRTVAGSAALSLDAFQGYQREFEKHGFLWWDVEADELVLVPEGIDVAAPNPAKMHAAP